MFGILRDGGGVGGIVLMRCATYRDAWQCVCDVEDWVFVSDGLSGVLRFSW